MTALILPSFGRIVLLQLMLIASIFLLECVEVAGAEQQTTSPAQIKNGVTYAGWLDKERLATVENVLTIADWQPFTGWKSWGFGNEPVWIRVSIPPSPNTNEPPHILILRQPHLDRVTFYDPEFGTVSYEGDFLPARDDALHSILFTFEVPGFSKQRDILIKIESTSTRLVHLLYLPLSEALSVTRGVEWVTSGILLLSVIFSLWAFSQWYETRDPVMGMFSAQQLLVTLWGFSITGFARIIIGEYFSPGTLSELTGFCAALMVAFIMWFFSLILREYNPYSWMMHVLKIGSFSAILVMIFTFTNKPYMALQLLNTIVTFLLTWVVAIPLVSRPAKSKPPISKSWMLAYVVSYAFLNAIPSLTHVGIIPESNILFFGNMSSLVANGLVMLIILNIRERQFKDKHRLLNQQLLLQEEQARIGEKYLQDQRRLLAMLAHEMKTPLSNLRVWMEAGPKGRPVMERAIYDMDRVIERCVHAGQISDLGLKPRDEWLDAVELTENLVTTSREPNRIKLMTPERDSAIFSDPQMIAIVLSNILENAYKYSTKGTFIEIKLKALSGKDGKEGLCWSVENIVDDTDQMDSKKIFDKYYRGTNAQRQSGSGLGLFLAKSLVELMQGEIVCVTNSQRVRFDVWIPVVPQGENLDKSDG